jgi:hypothetical protein
MGRRTFDDLQYPKQDGSYFGAPSTKRRAASISRQTKEKTVQ